MNDMRLATAGRHLEEMAQIGLQMEEDGVSGEHMKAMWAGQSNVLVAVRVRPLMKHDIIKKSCVRVLDSKVVVIMDPASGDKQDILRANRSREKQYAFDYVFEPGSSQESTYHHTTKFLIHGVLDGYNATVFAYGQTGSGKTHTMIGNPQDPGIMVRVMSDLFVHSATQGKQQGVHYKVSVSFLEVYNENIRDLLSDTEEYLDLREDPIKGPVVASITEIEATSGQEIMQLLIQGNAKRSQAATAANEVSSRSHAVLQVVVESRDRAPGTVANIKVGKLSLVDLAGSERAANTKNVGQRLVEGANINRSLLALGNCINALGEKGNKGNFVPYRDSKLTRLLKDSLGGNCRTVMIANISAAESSFEETLNTLKYANRAKNIKTNVQRNVLNVNYHISEYVQLINNLRSEIQILKGQISHGGQEHEGPGISPGVGGAGHPTPSRHAPSTPFQVLRESMRAATASVNGGEGRELVNNMRQRIVENFQERMQLRRSLIELEDQNVQNSIEVSKRQLIVVQWSEAHGNINKKNKNGEMPSMTKADFAADILANGDPEIIEAWQECEQLRKAIMKNNGMKKNIAKRLRHNEREAEKFRDELGDKITGEDRRELMELQYQVGRLELENMELEQHRIVHESILKGKDLVIQKLKLQLAVRDRLIARQQAVLVEHDLDNKVGYSQLAVMEQTLMGDYELGSTMAPPSPPRNMQDMLLPNDMMMHSVDSIAMSSVSQTGGLSSVAGGGGLSGQKHGGHGHGHHHNHKVHYGHAGGGAGAQVPPLRMMPASEHSTIDIDGDNEEEMYMDDGYEVVPVTERGEVALSSRDRDFIEQGDWSEINNELHDRDTSFILGKSPSSDFKRNAYQQPDSEEKHSKNNKNDVNITPSSVIARNTNNTNSNGSLNAGAVMGGGGGSSSKAVHGPRGGRHFRSAAEETPQAPAVPLGGKPKPKALSQPSDNFQIEDSDNESTNSNTKNNNNYGSNKHGGGGGGGGKAKITPRRGMGAVNSSDKLDPIPLPTAVEEGVLTGRKYEAAGGGGGGAGGGRRYNSSNNNNSNNSDRERDITPRRGNNSVFNYDSGHEAAGGGAAAAPAAAYAPIYPSLFNKDKSNAAGAGGGGPKVGVSAAAPSGNKEPPGYRRNSKGLLEPLEFPVDQFSDLNIGGKGVLNKQPSVKNVALGKGKKGSAASEGFNAAAGVAAVGVNREGAAMAAAENNSINSNNILNLNVNGSGFDSNGQPALAPLNSVRPANKMKPTRPSRKVTASDGGGGSIAENVVLSVDGVGSDALAVELGYRNKSLPNLPKQMGAPNSARDK